MPRLLRRWGIPIFVLVLLLAVAGIVFGGRGQEGRLIDAGGSRVFVADGDTLHIGAETVRLARLDAVERTQFCLDAQGTSWSCGQTALASLGRIVARGALHCTAIERDHYGRTLAHCTVAGGGDVGAAMVEAGWAVADGPRYAAEQQAARAAKRGIWASRFEIPRIWRDRHRIEPKMVR